MVREIKPHGPLPSQDQLAYLGDELAAFIHFGPNTFYDQEWGTGQEDPERFNPTRLDAREWVRVLKETGFKKLILVVKHHDGFVLYPTAHTDYSVKASPWRNGEGDLLLEVSQAATEFDMDMGVYLSPWDAHSPLYHVEREADYNAYYLAQLKEILSNPAYGNEGKFAEVWMDGARGEGAQKVNYEFEKWFETIRELQGDCLIFSTEGTSIRWIGNERGYAGDPLWQKVNSDKLGTEAELDYLQHGDPSGTIFSIGEADVSIRPGWFYHEDQDSKSLEELVEIYFHSVGRGTPLLLNIPPNQAGLFDAKDIERLYEFAAYRNELYKEDLALGAKVSGSALSADFACHYLTDGLKTSSWASDAGLPIQLELDLGSPKTFDVIELREDLKLGQRIAGFYVQVEVDGVWQEFGTGFTVGYKRLLRGSLVEAQKVRVMITESQDLPVLTKISLYKTPSLSKTEVVQGLAFAEKSLAVTKGETLHFRIERSESNTPLEAKISIQPGTGVHGVAYQDEIQVIEFQVGETEKRLTLPTLYFAGDKTLDFYLNLTVGGQLLDQLQVQVS
ncbi:alpha-L-fucosidase [Streptococcus mitis]|uniref:alpha-L-fucosidase n=1 Tax=Streptococcus mitis TaxID=28037 RepID=A0AAX2L673_STRMT|nr:alpha-L-fucosidase [Streptococcus mitis]MBZ2103206.1 alpha-L-fucosidase [Streptococcus mitis]OOS17035.1 alpha-L-fucosidase [Streptococcus mitis]QBZ12532.1 alpha-L-fucosidase 1 domain protein [Streptococcus mitis NCTC 12261]QGS43038.1 alpha-L-fucosidase [Streptococcus mitis]QXA55679.1 alpha-L-fucosidase [Streptococcus mitis]